MPLRIFYKNSPCIELVYFVWLKTWTSPWFWGPCAKNKNWRKQPKYKYKKPPDSKITNIGIIINFSQQLKKTRESESNQKWKTGSNRIRTRNIAWALQLLQIWNFGTGTKCKLLLDVNLHYDIISSNKISNFTSKYLKY